MSDVTAEEREWLERVERSGEFNEALGIVIEGALNVYDDLDPDAGVVSVLDTARTIVAHMRHERQQRLRWEARIKVLEERCARAAAELRGES